MSFHEGTLPSSSLFSWERTPSCPCTRWRSQKEAWPSGWTWRVLPRLLEACLFMGKSLRYEKGRKKEELDSILAFKIKKKKREMHSMMHFIVSILLSTFYCHCLFICCSCCCCRLHFHFLPSFITGSLPTGRRPHSLQSLDRCYHFKLATCRLSGLVLLGHQPLQQLLPMLLTMDPAEPDAEKRRGLVPFSLWMAVLVLDLRDYVERLPSMWRRLVNGMLVVCLVGYIRRHEQAPRFIVLEAELQDAFLWIFKTTDYKATKVEA